MFFVVMWLLTLRRPDRKAYRFAAVVSVLYAIIDAASVSFAGIWDVQFAASMLAKLVAALAGAFVGSRIAAKSPAVSKV